MDDLIRSTIFVEKDRWGEINGRLSICGLWDYDNGLIPFYIYIMHEDLEEAGFDLTKCSLSLYYSGNLRDDVVDFKEIIEWGLPTSYYKNKEGYKKDEEIKFSDIDLTEYKNAFNED